MNVTIQRDTFRSLVIPLSGIGGRPRIYLILFAPNAFVSQRQDVPSKLLSLLAFLRVSTDFTPTHRIPLASPSFKNRSFGNTFQVELGDFTPDFLFRLHTLYAQ